MNLIKFVLRTCRGMMIFTGLVALLSGACNAGLIALVNTALNNPQASTTILVVSFAGLGLGKIATGFLSQLMLTRFAQGGGSYLSSSDRRHIFGLGKAGRVERLTVAWPWGQEEHWDGLAVDRYLRLVEGSGS